MIDSIFENLKNGQLTEAYIHCHECEWSQDDFWNSSYNPVRFLLNWENDLLSEGLDEDFTEDAEFIKEHGNISRREVIAQECESVAAKIRNMQFMVQPDMGEAKCPNCGSALDVD